MPVYLLNRNIIYGYHVDQFVCLILPTMGCDNEFRLISQPVNYRVYAAISLAPDPFCIRAHAYARSLAHLYKQT